MNKEKIYINGIIEILICYFTVEIFFFVIIFECIVINENIFWNLYSHMRIFRISESFVTFFFLSVFLLICFLNRMEMRQKTDYLLFTIC